MRVIFSSDENSPLFGETADSLLQSKGQILVFLTGIDETVAQMIHTRHIYPAHKIFWNHQFVDIFYETPDGDRFLDFTHFHDVVSN